MPINRFTQRGFSLLEVLIALFILGLILTTATTGFSSYALNSQHKKTEIFLQDIQQALVSHMVINGFLPCPEDPANPNAGQESRSATTGQCSVTHGFLPYLNLDGIGREDGFGNRFFYAINQDADNSLTSLLNIQSSCTSASVFANQGSTNDLAFCSNPERSFCRTTSLSALANCQSAGCTGTCHQVATQNGTPYFNRLTPPIGTITGPNGLIICSENTTSCNSTTMAAANYFTRHIPIVFGSYGQNGAQTWSDCNNANPKERENCDNDRYFQIHPYADDYDDQIKWLSMQQIKAVMQTRIDWHLP